MINLIIGIGLITLGGFIGIGIMCLLQINRDNDTDNELYKRICDAMDYINFLVIFNENINGKFNETIWGEELLEILGGDVD